DWPCRWGSPFWAATGKKTQTGNTFQISQIVFNNGNQSTNACNCGMGMDDPQAGKTTMSVVFPNPGTYQVTFSIRINLLCSSPSGSGGHGTAMVKDCDGNQLLSGMVRASKPFWNSGTATFTVTVTTTKRNEPATIVTYSPSLGVPHGGN